MHRDGRGHLKLYLLLALTVVLLDFLSKRWVESALEFGQAIPVTGFFNLVLAHNTGAAFSLLADAGGWQRLFFGSIAAAASAVIVYLLVKHGQRTLFALALSLILGGALGNLIDRIRLGHVIDFLDFYVQNHHWPAFNLADSAIFAGAALLVWDSFRKPEVKP